MAQLTAGSLFSGIGGIDLAFSLAGFDVRWQVEIDDYCRRVLTKHAPTYWPNAKQFEDVRHVGSQQLAPVDVIFGGFPCQDISQAGKGAGIKEGTRSGLWFEFRRLIGELRPRIVFLENVPAIVGNGRGGVAVIADLAALGYGCEWGIIPASSVGAPHLRERFFCVAYAMRERWGSSRYVSEYRGDGEGTVFVERFPDGSGENLANTHSDQYKGQAESTQRFAQHYERGGPDGGSQPCMGRIFDGIPARLDRIRRSTEWPARPGESQKEWESPRTVPARSVANRNNRIKALGNAVVPQVIVPFAAIIRDLLINGLR